MACKKHDRERDEFLVCDTLFKVKLNEVAEGVFDLVATPCHTPTSIFCVARITKRENCCNNMTYFQSFINTDPVEIIQDCDLDEIICRSIEIFFRNMPRINCRDNDRCERRPIFGLF